MKPMSPIGKFTVSVLAFQEGEWWSAQCLQYDIAAQAKTLPDLFYELERTLMGYFLLAAELGQVPFAGIGAAPQKFWDVFEQSAIRLESTRAPFRLPQSLPLDFLPDIRITNSLSA